VTTAHSIDDRGSPPELAPRDADGSVTSAVVQLAVMDLNILNGHVNANDMIMRAVCSIRRAADYSVTGQDGAASIVSGT